jgi:hypothetical protein
MSKICEIILFSSWHIRLIQTYVLGNSEIFGFLGSLDLPHLVAGGRFTMMLMKLKLWHFSHLTVLRKHMWPCICNLYKSKIAFSQHWRLFPLQLLSHTSPQVRGPGGSQAFGNCAEEKAELGLHFTSMLSLFCSK